MKREECISVLQALWRYKDCGYSEHKVRESLDMAIKALKQEPCKDCIDRSKLGLTDFEIVMCDGDYKKALKMLLDKIEKAPSVQPKSSFINKPCISEGVCHDIAVQKMIKCEDAVSREAVFNVLNCGQDLPDRLFDMVEELPKVYLEPKVGHWIPDDTICEDTLYRCSNCDNVYYSDYGDVKDMGYNFCPNCGAKMESDGEE